MQRTAIVAAVVVLVLLTGAYAFRQWVMTQPLSAEISDAPPPATETTAIEPAAGGETVGGIPPGAGQGAPPPIPLPPAAAGDPPEMTDNGHAGGKVISYFQQAKTKLDTARAFGFVLLPKAAVTDGEKRTQKSFCDLMLASMDFMTPSAVAGTAPAEVLATYWPIVAAREAFEVNEAFRSRNCDDLIAWYDHSLARKLAAKSGVAGLTGPLLITWPSGGGDSAVRDPLIVDFSKANHERAAKALQYWFRQLRNRPDLWTNRIREGTIRAELADAVNDTAGVVLAVMAGKWEGLNTVASP